MPYKVVFRKQASDEALEAAEYIALHSSPHVALRWYEGLEKAIASLAQMPDRFALARENRKFKDIELRQLVYKSHRLIFVVRSKTVHVLHVRHVAQKPLEAIPDDN